MSATTLYIADQYRRGCPSNASSPRIGYGLTARAAVENCDPWNNQAPYAPNKARAVVLADGEGFGEEVWAIIGMPTGFEDGHHAQAIKAAEKKQWSEAIRLAALCELI